MGTRTVGTTSRKTGGIFVPIFKEVRNIKSKTYEEFVEKFKPKKTTDDCYTPPEIYEVIKDWVCKRYNIDSWERDPPILAGRRLRKRRVPAGMCGGGQPAFFPS